MTLKVAEGGFAGPQKPREEWLQDRSDNVQGWDTELAAALTFLERP